MKKLLTLFFFTPLFTPGQVPFSPEPFDHALETAKRENRILMVQLYSPDCAQCNEVADKGLQSPEVQEAIRANKLLPLSYQLSQQNGQDFIRRYRIPSGAATAFISPSGNLIHLYNGSTSFSASYVQHIRQAMKKLDDEKAIEPFEKAFAEGSRDPAVLVRLLQLRENLGRERGMLLDDYARSLPPDSLASLSQLQLLAGFAPVLHTYADSVMRANRDRFQEAWYRMDLPTRININNRIIIKSKAIAIREKNRIKIQQVANFASRVQNNPYDRSRMYNTTLMDYHRSVGDTASYLFQTELFIEGQVMHVSPDSIRQLDSIAKRKMMEDSRNAAPVIPGTGNQTMTYTRSFSYAPKVQFFANELNNAAFSVYSMTKDSKWTEKALRWSQRSLEFNETHALLDTYAKLLYRNGQREKAIATQQKALDLELKRGMKGSALRETLENMKAGKEL